MAKKKTGGIPRKLPPVGTTQRPKRELPGKTIPERFRALEDLFPGPVPKREVAGFLSQENHRASTRSRRKQTTDLGPECSELLQYLLNNYGKTYVAMACREAPFLMETGFNYLEEIHDTDHLTEEQCNRANVLGNFVMNIRADRVCTFFLGSANGQKEIRLPAVIARKELDDQYTDLEETILDAMQKKGILLLRCSSTNSSHEVVFGFRLTLDHIAKMRTRELEQFLDTMQNGTRSPDSSVICLVADVDLP